MRTTDFAGLTALEPGDENVAYANNGKYVSDDRDEIDRVLGLGAKTHRHTGLPGLSDPTDPPEASILPTGGNIAAGLEMTVGYTIEDADGGETRVSPTVEVATAVAMDVPLNEPVVEADYTEGSLLTDTYYYALTYTDGGGGETPMGPTAEVEREPGYEFGRIMLSGLTEGMEDAEAVGWRLYRARGDGEFHLIATGDDTEDEFVDDGTIDVDCDVTPPTDNQNTTANTNRLSVTLPVVDDDAEWINVYCTLEADFTGSCLLAQYPAADGGDTKEFTALELLDSSPPDVNRSYGGAPLIDPDTEILNWPWRRAVANVAALPTPGVEDGEARYVKSEDTIYIWHALPDAEWRPLEGAAGITAIAVYTGALATSIYDDFADLDPAWTDFGLTGPTHYEIDAGELAPTSAGVTNQPVMIYRDDLLSDGALSAKFTAGTIVGDSGAGGIALYDIDSSRFLTLAVRNDEDLVLYSDDTGDHALDTLPSPIVASDVFWLRMTKSGNDITGEFWETDPAFGGAPTASGTFTLVDAGDIANFGTGVTNNGGLQLYAPDDGWRVDDFTFEAAGAPVEADSIQVLGDGGVGVDVEESPAGTAVVTIKPPSRRWGEVVQNIGAGAQANVAFPLEDNAVGARLLAIETDKEARVRVYGDPDDRTADAARPVGTDPTGDHGVLLDYVVDNTGGDLRRLSPAIDAHNLEDPPLETLYLRVTNDDTAGDLTVRLLYVPTEVA